MTSFLLVCVAVVLPLVVSAENDYVVSQPVPAEGEEFLLECGGYGEMSYFLLHQKGSALRPVDEVLEDDKLDIKVFQNASVYFKSVSIEHQGTHLCIRNIGNAGEVKYHGFTTELRVRPMPSQNLWEDVYKAKFVTGFIAALVIASLFVIGCLVEKYRWRPKQPDTEPMFSNSAYVNPAMTNDDAESGCSTKM